MVPLLKFTGKDLQEMTMPEWLATKPEALQFIASKWFKAIQICGPDVQSIFHDGHPIGCVDDTPFAYVDAFRHHVNLGFFHGADLPDDKGLLEGTGKRMRHIKLRPGEDQDAEAIKRLLVVAYVDIKERYAVEFSLVIFLVANKKSDTSSDMSLFIKNQLWKIPACGQAGILTIYDGEIRSRVKG